MLPDRAAASGTRTRRNRNDLAGSGARMINVQRKTPPEGATRRQQHNQPETGTSAPTRTPVGTVKTAS